MIRNYEIGKKKKRRQSLLEVIIKKKEELLTIIVSVVPVFVGKANEKEEIYIYGHAQRHFIHGTLHRFGLRLFARTEIDIL